MEEKYFFQYLSQPLKVLIFEPDDLIFFATGVLLGIFSTDFYWKTGIWAVTGVTVWQYMKIKAKYPRGFYGHIQYYAGLTSLEMYPSGLQKEFSE